MRKAIATTDLPRLSADQGAFEALLELNQSRAEVALVEDGGEVVGAISNDDFSAVLDIRRGASPA